MEYDISADRFMSILMKSQLEEQTIVLERLKNRLSEQNNEIRKLKTENDKLKDVISIMFSPDENGWILEEDVVNILKKFDKSIGSAYICCEATRNLVKELGKLVYYPTNALKNQCTKK